MRDLSAARQAQQAIDAARLSSLPQPEVREIAFDDLMPMERTGLGAFFRAWTDTEFGHALEAKENPQ